jgi:hypothetical protein
LRHKIGQHTRFEFDTLGFLENRWVVVLYLSEQCFESLLNLQWTVYSVSFIRRGEKLNLITVSLVVNLAEDQLQQFPERLGLL